MINLLIITGSWPFIKCGVGDYTYNLYNTFKNNKGLNTYVLTSTDAEKSDENVLNIVNKWSGLKIVSTILRVIREKNIDIVQFEFPTSKYKSNSISFYIILPYILRIKRIKVVYTIHEYSDNSTISKYVRRFAIKNSNSIIVVDKRFKEEIEKKYKKVKTVYIPISSNIQKSTIDESTILMRRNKLLDEFKCKTILSYFGFINSSKCLDLVLMAMGELKEENKLSSVLLFLGDFDELKCGHSYFSYLKEIIEKYSLESNIYITGFLNNSEVGDYFKLSDAAILLFKNGVSVRNGSMLAAYQEGLTIITSYPKQEDIFFAQKQFILIDNNLNEIKNSILKIQNFESKTNYEVLDLSWDKVAVDHYTIYNELLSKNGENKGD